MGYNSSMMNKTEYPDVIVTLIEYTPRPEYTMVRMIGGLRNGSYPALREPGGRRTMIVSPEVASELKPLIPN